MWKESYRLSSPGPHLCGLAWDGAHLWYSDGEAHQIYRLALPEGAIMAQVPCPDVRTCLGYDGTHLWQIAGHPKRIRVIRPVDGTTVKELPLHGEAEEVCALYVTPDSYWTGSKVTGILEHRCHDGNLLATYDTGGSAHGLYVREGVAYYTDYPGQALVAWDLAVKRPRWVQSLPGHPTGLTGSSDYLWYCDYTHRQIVALTR